MCRSDSDPKCGDPFDNSSVPITDCKQERDLEHLPGVRPTMCRKIRQKGKVDKFRLIGKPIKIIVGNSWLKLTVFMAHCRTQQCLTHHLYRR